MITGEENGSGCMRGFRLVESLMLLTAPSASPDSGSRDPFEFPASTIPLLKRAIIGAEFSRRYENRVGQLPPRHQCGSWRLQSADDWSDIGNLRRILTNLGFTVGHVEDPIQAAYFRFEYFTDSRLPGSLFMNG